MMQPSPSPPSLASRARPAGAPAYDCNIETCFMLIVDSKKLEYTCRQVVAIIAAVFCLKVRLSCSNSLVSIVGVVRQSPWLHIPLPGLARRRPILFLPRT